MAHNDEKAEPTGTAAGHQPVWMNQWTVYALAGATAIALILAVTGWSKANNYRHEAEGLRGQVNDLNGQVTGLQGQVTGLQSQVTGLQGQVATVSGERDALKPSDSVASLEQEIDGLGVERSLYAQRPERRRPAPGCRHLGARCRR